MGNRYSQGNDRSRERHARTTTPRYTNERGNRPVTNRPRPVAAEEESVQVRTRKRGYNAAQKRKRNMRIFYIITFLVVLAAAMVVFCNVLLKISDIQITGASRYSLEEILEACPIKMEENMVAADTEQAQKTIEEELPYIQTATVKKKLPSQISIHVEAAEVFCAIAQGEKYILISREWKILEVTDALPENSLTVTGIILLSPKAGEQMQYKNKEMQRVFESLVAAIEESELTPITAMDFTDLYNVQLEYDGRITLLLGVPSELPYKLAFGKSIIENKDGNGIEPDAKGTLDLSRAESTDKAVFTPLESAASSVEENAESQSGATEDVSSTPENTGEENTSSDENGANSEPGEN